MGLEVHWKKKTNFKILPPVQQEQ